MGTTEKEKTVKVWIQHPGVEASRVVEYIEKLEKEGWTIFQLLHTNEIVQKTQTKVLNLSPQQQQPQQMVLVVHAICYKWILPDSEHILNELKK